jgi:MFS family permease
MAEATTARPSLFSVFRNRNFTFMWTGDLISQFGSGITAIASSILVYRVTGSALSVGLMLMATALPGLIFGLIAGVFVDRVDRKRIMVVANVIRALLIGMIPLLLPYGIHWLYISVALSSTIAQFFNPASESVLPDVATEQELASANSLLSISSVGAMGLGYAAAGFITSNLPVEIAFYIDAVTFVVAALLVVFVAIPPITVEDDTNVGVVLHNLKEGGTFLWNSPILRSAFLIMIPMAVLFGLNNSILLPFATRALNATEFEYSLIEGLSLVGFVVGGFVMAAVADRLREGQWIAISFFGMGAAMAVTSQLNHVPIVIAVSIIGSFFNVPVFIARRLIVQRNTRREVRGRVASAFSVSRDVMFVVGMGLAGLADVMDIRLLLLIVGALLVALGVVAVVVPGLGRPAAEWKRAIALLRGAASAPGLAPGRAVTLVDLETYAASIPLLAALTLREQQHLIAEVRYIDAAAGTAIVRQGERSDAAYFILSGRAVAGRAENGQEQVLETLHGGDFFGEIAALSGIPRTANVVVDEPAALLRVPAATLKEMSANPELNRIFYSKMMERMVRMNMVELPRITGVYSELRAPQPAEPLPLTS